MPQNSNAAAGYRQPAQSGNTPRETEGRALMESARRLSNAQKDGDQAKIIECIRLNWRLWTIFQAELTSPECAVPTEIRQNMLNLCNFVDKRTVEILADPKPELLTVLVNINRNVGAGLLSSTEDEEKPAPPDIIPSSNTGGISA